ncbi:uncharacterized protein [Typha latifolia]|uniref:uncharacterized protein n=1 Tax=Typha latifolia TaxID=4733 RepID=UPI003C2F0F15
MKARAIEDDGDGGIKKSKWNKRNRRRNEQRLGGKGLSLESFANAKSNPSGYNPSIIKKQREFYKNAKFVSKYKRTVKNQRQPGVHYLTVPNHEEGNNTENVRKPSKKKKQNLQTLREEYEKKRAEDEKAKMEREAMIQARREEKAKAEAKRKALRERMFKKTRSGQPVMKYRIEHLLEGLIESSKN